jgi:RNA polymerase sigma-70 factor, ECF subfamily
MWPDTIETDDLLKRAEQADAQAVERLWDRHREPLRRMIHLRLDHQLGRRVDASDVVQEVLLEANRRLNSYLRKPEMPFHLWLRQIASDHVIDQHRRHRGAARRSLDREQPMVAGAFPDQSSVELAAQLRDPGPTPLAAALRSELERRFQDALQQLDEGDREVILLRHFEHLSNSEVARVLGLSEAAAGMRYLRAIRRVRLSLAEPPSQRGTP